MNAPELHIAIKDGEICKISTYKIGDDGLEERTLWLVIKAGEYAEMIIQGEDFSIEQYYERKESYELPETE